VALCTLKLLTKAFNDGVQLRDTLHLFTNCYVKGFSLFSYLSKQKL